MQNFSRPRPLQLPLRVQWRSILMSRHNFTACNGKSLSRYLSVQLFISISCSTISEKLATCSTISEKLANRGIVWLNNGKGGGLPGNTEAPLPTCLNREYECQHAMSPIASMQQHIQLAQMPRSQDPVIFVRTMDYRQQMTDRRRQIN